MSLPQEIHPSPSREGEGRNGLAGELVTIRDPGGAASEAYRLLRTNLLYAPADVSPKVIVLTSANPREGKSTIAANLGVALRRAEKDTLILDCDLRRPRLHELFRTRNSEGLVDVLVGDREPREVWQEPIPGLKLMPSGPPSSTRAELLSSRRLSEFLWEMRKEFEYVLVDTPPVGWSSDPSVLAANADGVLLVLDPRRTPKRSLRQTLRDLEGVGASVLGIVVNNCEAARDRRFHAHGY